MPLSVPPIVRRSLSLASSRSCLLVPSSKRLSSVTVPRFVDKPPLKPPKPPKDYRWVFILPSFVLGAVIGRTAVYDIQDLQELQAASQAASQKTPQKIVPTVIVSSTDSSGNKMYTRLDSSGNPVAQLALSAEEIAMFERAIQTLAPDTKSNHEEAARIIDLPTWAANESKGGKERTPMHVEGVVEVLAHCGGWLALLIKLLPDDFQSKRECVASFDLLFSKILEAAVKDDPEVSFDEAEEMCQREMQSFVEKFNERRSC